MSVQGARGLSAHNEQLICASPSVCRRWCFLRCRRRFCYCVCFRRWCGFGYMSDDSPIILDGSTELVAPPDAVSDTQAGASAHHSDDDTSSFCSVIDCIESGQIPRVINRVKKPRQNSNRVSQYSWLEELLRVIVVGDTAGAAGSTSRPLFVVAGACPSRTANKMQAVLYSKPHADAALDFWWVKPRAKDALQLESATLEKHTQGPHKNAMGMAGGAVYSPLADKFSAATSAEEDHWDVDSSSGRAFIEERAEDGRRRRLFIFFVWQEAWSGVMSRRKWMEGKLCYQVQELGTNGCSLQERFYARQYKVLDDRVLLATARDEEEVPSLLPPDSFQELYDLDW